MRVIPKPAIAGDREERLTTDAIAPFYPVARYRGLPQPTPPVPGLELAPVSWTG